jgi:site-specific recombinase XerD
MTDLVQEFCDYYHAYNDISPARRVAQRRVLAEFVARVGGVDELDADALRAYLATLITQNGMAATTVTQRLTMIRPFIDWLREQRKIDADRLLDLRAVKPPRGGSSNGQPRPYSRKEIQAMWARLEEVYPFATDVPPGERVERGEWYLARWERGTSRYARAMPYFKRCQVEAVLHLALWAGLLREEIFRLELEDVDPGNQYLVVRSARKNKEAEQTVRPVPMGNALRDALTRWFELREKLDPPHDRPWLSLHTDLHKSKAIRFRTFGALLLPVGVEYHRLRHTFATESLRAGMPLEYLSKIMGHKRMQQTLRYAELVEVDVVRASERAAPLFDRAMTRRREKVVAA